MTRRSSWVSLLVVSLVPLGAPDNTAAQSFPYPRPAPCAGPSVVATAVQELAETRWRRPRAPWTNGVRTRGARRAPSPRPPARRAIEAALEAVFQRCIYDCRDASDRYLARIDYAGALERFGDVAGAESQYQQAIAMRPGRPPDGDRSVQQLRTAARATRASTGCPRASEPLRHRGARALFIREPTWSYG